MSNLPEAESDSRRRFLLDTHVFVWYVEGRERIGENARATIETAVADDGAIVSAITPWEIALLVSKQRLTLNSDVMNWVNEALSKPGVMLVGLEPEIAVASTRLPFEMHGDPADRILVATARQVGATLVTADKALLEAAKKGHFRAMDAEA